MRILGPNCIGALVPGVGLNACFAPGNALPGPLAFVTQSGALAGSDAVFNAVVRRAGMLRVDSRDALFDAAEALAHAPTGQAG